MHKIIIPHGVLSRLAQDVGVSKRTVQNALCFVTEGEQPDLIRKRAIEYFSGILIDRPVNIKELKKLQKP